MSVLANPTVKSVLMIIVVLAVLGGVAYLIYHFTAGTSHSDATHPDTRSSSATTPGTTPMSSPATRPR